MRTEDAAKPYFKGVAAWLAQRKPLDTKLDCYRGTVDSAALAVGGPTMEQLLANAVFLRPSEKDLAPLSALEGDDRFKASNPLRLADAQQIFWASGRMLGPVDAGPAAVARALASGNILPFQGRDRTSPVPDLDCSKAMDGAASVEYCPLVAMGGAEGRTPQHIGCLIRIQKASAPAEYLVGFTRDEERKVFLQEVKEKYETVRRDFAWEVQGQAVMKETPLVGPYDEDIELHGVEITWGAMP